MRPASILAGLFLIALTLRPQIVGVGSLLPDIQESLDTTHAVAGLLATIPVLCMGLFAPPAAYLSSGSGPALPSPFRSCLSASSVSPGLSLQARRSSFSSPGRSASEWALPVLSYRLRSRSALPLGQPAQPASTRRASRPDPRFGRSGCTPRRVVRRLARVARCFLARHFGARGCLGRAHASRPSTRASP